MSQPTIRKSFYVGIAVSGYEKGQRLGLWKTVEVSNKNEVPYKIALQDEGDTILKYGHDIGKVNPIEKVRYITETKNNGNTKFRL